MKWFRFQFSFALIQSNKFIHDLLWVAPFQISSTHSSILRKISIRQQYVKNFKRFLSKYFSFSFWKKKCLKLGLKCFIQPSGRVKNYFNLSFETNFFFIIQIILDYVCWPVNRKSENNTKQITKHRICNFNSIHRNKNQRTNSTKKILFYCTSQYSL